MFSANLPVVRIRTTAYTSDPLVEIPTPTPYNLLLGMKRCVRNQKEVTNHKRIEKFKIEAGAKHIHTCTHIHIYTYTHVHIYTYMPRYAQMQTEAHTYTHIHHTHTDAERLWASSKQCSFS
jgi:hypothetical protein